MTKAKMFVVYYRLWPGMGIKGLATCPDHASQIIRQCIKSYRMSNLVEPLHEGGFEVLEMQPDVLIIGTRMWSLELGGPREVTGELLSDQAAPEVPQVPGQW